MDVCVESENAKVNEALTIVEDNVSGINPKKRRGTSLDNGEKAKTDDVNGRTDKIDRETPQDRIYEVVFKLREVCHSTVFRAEGRSIEKLLKELQKSVHDLSNENQRLIGRNEELNKEVDRLRDESKTNGAYVGVPRVGALPTVTKENPGLQRLQKEKVVQTWATVLTSGIGNGLSQQQVFDAARQVLPKVKIPCEAIKKRRDGSVELRTLNEADRLKLINSDELASKGIVAKTTTKLGPRLVIFDVPMDVTAEKIVAEIQEHTLGFMTLDEIRKNLRVIERPINNGNVVVECTLRIYKMLIEKRKIMIDYVFCRLREDTYVPHCWKCLALSHHIRECKVIDRVCRKCGVEGHHSNECGNPVCCRTCTFKGLQSNHSTLSVMCPFYARAVERINARH